jgi:hypothetical protein
LGWAGPSSAVSWSNLDNFESVLGASRAVPNTHTAFTASEESHITRPAVAGKNTHVSVRGGGKGSNSEPEWQKVSAEVVVISLHFLRYLGGLVSGIG